MFELDPPMRRGAAGNVGAYVATNLYEGRPLFDALTDDYVQRRRDAFPDLLAQLASDEVVRTAIASQGRRAV